MGHLGSNHLMMDYLKQLHLCREFHSLHLKTDFSELYRDNMEIGNPALEGGWEGLFEDAMRTTQ